MVPYTYERSVNRGMVKVIHVCTMYIHAGYWVVRVFVYHSAVAGVPIRTGILVVMERGITLTLELPS